MSQTLLTTFFQVRKQLPDQHAAKKRKIIYDEESYIEEASGAGNNEEKSDEQSEVPVGDVEKENESPNLNEDKEFISFGSVVTSAVDDHNKNNSNESQVLPSTPSTSKHDDSSSNQRASKRSQEEKTGGKEDWTPTTSSEVLFTIGVGEDNRKSVAKKKLNMNPDMLHQQPRVSFKKLGVLSPKKNCSPSKVDFRKLEMKLTPKKLTLEENNTRIFTKTGTEKDNQSDFVISSAVKNSHNIEEKMTPTNLQDEKNPKDISRELFSSTNNGTMKEDQCDPVKSAIKDAQALKAKMSPADVKKKLGNVKLADLRNRLAAINNSSIKAKEAARGGAKITLPPSSSISLEVEVPKVPSSPQKVPTTPKKLNSGVKASPRKVPAYQRFHSLTQPTDKTLPLPYSYRLLAEVFRSMDTVVSMFFNRKEVITMDKLEKAVKKMMNRPFLSRYTGQIHCVFPQAYTFSWERTQRGLNGERELHIRPNLRYKRALLEEFEVNVGEGGTVKMLSEHLVERRGIFHNALVQMVKDQHSDFLKSLDPPITVVDSKITAWHKEFDVDSCSDIDTADLPPNPNLKKMAGPQDLLERMNQVAPQKVKVAETVVAETTQQNDCKEAEQKAAVSDSLAGIPSALLAKIRAKEAARALQLMTRTPEEIQKISLLKRLPSLARMVRNLLIQEKKAALTVEFTCRKLVDGIHPKTEKTQVEGDLRAMCEETRGWLSIHLVGNVEYFKIGKTDINKVCERLERKLKDLQ